MKRLWVLAAPLALSACYSAQCVDDAAFTPQMEPVPGFLWLAADHDATVACDRDDQTAPRRCPAGFPGDQAFGTGATVDVEGRLQSTERKRIYARFYLPGLPAGVQVVEARINLFDLRPVASGNTEVVLNGAKAVGAWNGEDITWNNQPNDAAAVQQEFTLISRANQWSPSKDIAQLIVQPIVSGAQPNNGVMISYFANTTGTDFENSYNSDNNGTRTEDDMDQAPRLLLRLSQPVSCAALTLPAVVWTDTDLDASLGGAPFTSVLMVRTGHTNWPASWNVPPPF